MIREGSTSGAMGAGDAGSILHGDATDGGYSLARLDVRLGLLRHSGRPNGALRCFLSCFRFLRGCIC